MTPITRNVQHLRGLVSFGMQRSGPQKLDNTPSMSFYSLAGNLSSAGGGVLGTGPNDSSEGRRWNEPEVPETSLQKSVLSLRLEKNYREIDPKNWTVSYVHWMISSLLIHPWDYLSLPLWINSVIPSFHRLLCLKGSLVADPVGKIRLVFQHNRSENMGEMACASPTKSGHHFHGLAFLGIQYSC